MNCTMAVLGACKDVFCLGYCIGSSMNNQKELVGLQRDVVLEHAVLGDANAHKACAHRAYASDKDRAFKCCDDPAY